MQTINEHQARRIVRRVQLKTVAAKDTGYDRMLKALALWSVDFNADVLANLNIYGLALAQYASTRDAEIQTHYQAWLQYYINDLNQEPDTFEGQYEHLKYHHQHDDQDEIDARAMGMFNVLSDLFDQRAATIGSLTLDDHLELAGWYAVSKAY